VSPPSPKPPSPKPSNPRPAKLTVSVEGNHCHLYGICEAEAPGVFRLAGGRLHYMPKPAPTEREAVRSAARLCPMQAIHLQER